MSKVFRIIAMLILIGILLFWLYFGVFTIGMFYSDSRYQIGTAVIVILGIVLWALIFKYCFFRKKTDDA